VENFSQGYVIYTTNESYMSNICCSNFNFSQPNNITKPYLLTNAQNMPGLIGCFQSGIDIINSEHTSIATQRIPSNW